MTKTITKNKLGSIRLVQVIDEYPDLSHLGKFSNTPELEGSINHRERTGEGSRVFKYFNAGNPEFAEQSYKRMMEYENGDFSYIGIMAEARIDIPHGSGNFIVHRISSPGLYGIESDSNESYFKEVAKEEMENLREMLEQLNADMTNFDALAKQALESQRICR